MRIGIVGHRYGMMGALAAALQAEAAKDTGPQHEPEVKASKAPDRRDEFGKLGNDALDHADKIDAAIELLLIGRNDIVRACQELAQACPDHMPEAANVVTHVVFMATKYAKRSLEALLET